MTKRKASRLVSITFAILNAMVIGSCATAKDFGMVLWLNVLSLIINVKLLCFEPEDREVSALPEVK